ncbi:MAG: ribosome biogenesis GTPase Der [Planctomycetes bacterium]|nr:ribosome biogenesis GTPase Der [Planctomycetota bacterium]
MSRYEGSKVMGKFKSSVAKRKRPANSKIAKKRKSAQAARKAKRPNAKVVGGAKKKHKKRPVKTDDATFYVRETAQGKPFTKKIRSAAELGVEARGARALPTVAIVGRPNVGKSSLFNVLAGSRIAIEDPRPGTTRDRVSAQVQMKPFQKARRVIDLFDTAGIGIVDEDEVQDHVFEQIENAVATADLVLMIVDVRDGLLELDRVAAKMLRKAGRKIILVANKADDPQQNKLADAFYELGLGDPCIVSAKGKRKIKDLKDRICSELPPKRSVESLEPPELLLAVVGRRNVGKSTLTNQLAQSERVIASELSGTTRDSIDVRFEYDGRTFVAIDTAGVRKKNMLQHSVEFFSQSRSFRAVRRASVVILMLDATDPLAKVDMRLVDLAVDECKPLIIAVNKWDLVKGHTTDSFQEYLQKKLHAVDYAPIVFMSAKDGINTFELVDLARELHAQQGERIGTGELNRMVIKAFDKHHPQPRKNKLGRIFYATQVESFPPKIVVFVNDPTLFPDNWRKYLLHQLQEYSMFNEVPIRLKFKAREKVIMDEL